jgi:hypothetical protein
MTTPTRLMVSKELIGDRLVCMLEHIRCGRAEQVHLHAILFANVLSLDCPGAQKLRDTAHEAQALFTRGKGHLAEQRLEEADLVRLPLGLHSLRTFLNVLHEGSGHDAVKQNIDQSRLLNLPVDH